MKKLTYLFLALLIVACSSDDSSSDDNGNNDQSSSCNGENPIYLADNGVTIKAYECAEVGDTGVVNGVTYTVVDDEMLRTMVANEEDVTKVATTKVTSWVQMFAFTDAFNQPMVIGM